jgi:hypothetical protein
LFVPQQNWEGVEMTDIVDRLRAGAFETPYGLRRMAEEIERLHLQMAGISTAAIGYWKEGDSIHPDYDTVALRDVAKLYAKYDELYKQVHALQPQCE